VNTALRTATSGDKLQVEVPFPPLIGERSVLVVEDDGSLRESVVMLLEGNGFRAVACGDGIEASRLIAREAIDLLVLDLMLPGMDGLELCRRVRAVSPIPILILTARDETAMLVASLECGADDYLTKPFEAAELVARLRALARRAGRDPVGELPAGDDLRLDEVGFRLWKRGDPVALSATEFRLLVELVKHHGRVLSREALLEQVWGYDYLGDSRLVDMAVKRLRDKIEDDPSTPTHVITVRGVGYRFDVRSSEPPSPPSGIAP
jgi:two-component system response regulator MtrA